MLDEWIIDLPFQIGWNFIKYEDYDNDFNKLEKIDIRTLILWFFVLNCENTKKKVCMYNKELKSQHHNLFNIFTALLQLSFIHS